MTNDHDATGASFIFVANDVPIGQGATVSVERIAAELLGNRFWAFTSYAPLVRTLAEGNRVLIYLAGPKRRHFVATARVAGECAPNTPAEERVLVGLGLTVFQQSLPLSDVSWLCPPVPIRSLVPELGFIRDKQNYGLHLRMPVVRLQPGDWEIITRG